MAPYLIGPNAFAIKHFGFMMFQDFANHRGGLDFLSGLSGIEHALWDIVGKATGQPVYNLLGGPCRSKIRVYANGWADGGGPDGVAERALETVRGGFRALKWDPFPGPRRRLFSRAEEALATETDCFWYEEPSTTENLDNVAGIRRRTSVPVVELRRRHGLDPDERIMEVDNRSVGVAIAVGARMETAAMGLESRRRRRWRRGGDWRRRTRAHQKYTRRSQSGTHESAASEPSPTVLPRVVAGHDTSPH